MKKKSLLFIALLYLMGAVYAQSTPSIDFVSNEKEHRHAHNDPNFQIKFIENKGQFHKNVLFQTDIVGGKMFLEKDGFTFDFRNEEDWKRVVEIKHGDAKQQNEDDLKVRHHAYKMKFVDANLTPSFKGHDEFTEKYNYFLGSDRSKWASDVSLYNKVYSENIYKGIDLVTYQNTGKLKYDLIVHPGALASSIHMQYEGVKSLSINENGQLIVGTSVGNILEDKPFAYQYVNGQKVQIEARYSLDRDQLSFVFPVGYDKNKSLYIDPTIDAATYSGATLNSFGHTSTFDKYGNIYLGAVLVGDNRGELTPGGNGGYPHATGAFVTRAGDIDMIISKFNKDGSVLMSSTFLGGSDNDFPHSLIVDKNNQLYVLGSSLSPNFPIPGGNYNSYDDTHGGEADIVVTYFNENMSQLLGSTYIGSDKIDGQNFLSSDDKFPISGANYNFVNYGDEYKGEIILAQNGDVLIASMASSSDFPTTAGVIQEQKINPGVNNFSQEGVAIRLNSTLEQMIWSTYLGGTDEDAAYGIKEAPNGDIYVCGTATDDFPFTETNGQAAAKFDGFVVKMSGDAKNVLGTRILQTNGDSQAFFVQLDKNGGVYVLGQTNGANDGDFVQTGGKYQGPSTGSFIVKYDANLTNKEYVSQFGTIAPTAFLVDDCNFIYAVGHSGGAKAFTGSDFQVKDPFTGGNNPLGFYFMILEADATGLNFASFYGHPTSHVDGGTSRFDKRGAIYQGICTKPNTQTTANAAFPVSTVPTDPNAGLGTGIDYSGFALKVQLSVSKPLADAGVNINKLGCAPFAATFANANASDPNATHFWDFGDGTNTSTEAVPSFEWLIPGDYTIKYIITDLTKCIPQDSVSFDIKVLPAREFTPDFSIVEPEKCSTNDKLTLTIDINQVGIDSLSINWGNGVTNIAIDDQTTEVVNDYTNEGVYNVSLKAFDQFCLRDTTITKTLVYTRPPVPVATVDPIGNIKGCDPLLATLKVSTAMPDSSVVWFVDGVQVSTQFQFDYTFLDGGRTYDIQAIATTADTNYCEKTATVNAIAVVDEVIPSTFSIDSIVPPVCSNLTQIPIDINLDANATYSVTVDVYGDQSEVVDTVLRKDEKLRLTYDFPIGQLSVITVTYIDSLCADTSVFTQTVQPGGVVTLSDLIIPNIFTPNGDGSNDNYDITYRNAFVNQGNYYKYDIKIFNRWGNVVFEGGHQPGNDKLWDGTNEKRDLDEGVYFYQIDFESTCSVDDKKIRKSGPVHLVR